MDDATRAALCEASDSILAAQEKLLARLNDLGVNLDCNGLRRILSDAMCIGELLADVADPVDTEEPTPRTAAERKVDEALAKQRN